MARPPADALLPAFRKQLHGTGHAIIDSITPEEYTPQDWWRHEEGLVAFNNELIKLAFDLIKY